MRKKIYAVFSIMFVSALAGAAMVSFAMGSIPDNDGTLHGCYQNHKNSKEVQGQLRLVSNPANCKNNETAISWNQPQGSTAGPQVLGGEEKLAGGVPPRPRLFMMFGKSESPQGLDFESGTRQIAPIAGVVSDLYGQIRWPPDTGVGIQSRTVTVEKNGSPTGVGCTFTESDTQCSDLTNSVCFDVGDRAAMLSDISATVPGTGAGSVNDAFLAWTALFTPISGTCPP